MAKHLRPIASGDFNVWGNGVRVKDPAPIWVWRESLLCMGRGGGLLLNALMGIVNVLIWNAINLGGSCTNECIVVLVRIKIFYMILIVYQDCTPKYLKDGQPITCKGIPLVTMVT